MAGTPTAPNQTIPTPETIANELLAHIRQAGPTLGAKLGVLIRTLHPGFQPARYQARNLREFLERYAPQLRVVAKSGPDPIYGLGGDQVAVTRAQAEPSGPDLWRVWVSPAASYSLVIDKDTGRVRAGVGGQQASEAQVVLEPAPLDIHRALARSFLETITDTALRLELAGYLESEPQWWRRWLQVLHRNLQALAGWYEHRQRGLQEAFRDALRQAGLGEPQATAALGAIVSSRQMRPGTRRPPSVGGAAGPLRLLEIVHRVTSRMSEQELRCLNLPLGLVLDAVEGLQGRS